MAEYIEREALKEKLHKRLLNGNILAWLCGIINEAPAADVVPVVHGWWEPHPHAYGYRQCSVCHDCAIWGEWADEKKWGFCPQCGAKMDGE